MFTSSVDDPEDGAFGKKRRRQKKTKKMGAIGRSPVVVESTGQVRRASATWRGCAEDSDVATDSGERDREREERKGEKEK